MSYATLWIGSEDVYIKIPQKDLGAFLRPRQQFYYCSGCPYLHINNSGLPEEIKRSEFISSLKSRYRWSYGKESTCPI